MFILRYRFRRADFADMLLRMHLASEVGGNLHFKYLRSSKRSLIPADFAMMVMLQRLAYPCRFADLVCEFGKTTTYICDALHIFVMHTTAVSSRVRGYVKERRSVAGYGAARVSRRRGPCVSPPRQRPDALRRAGAAF